MEGTRKRVCVGIISNFHATYSIAMGKHTLSLWGKHRHVLDFKCRCVNFDTLFSETKQFLAYNYLFP